MRGLNGDTVVKLLNEYMRVGMFTRPARKDRPGGWTLIRQLLDGARTGRGPGLFIDAQRCPHLVETLPEAPRAPYRAEDVDPRWDRDHWLDALVYGARAIYDIYRLPQSSGGTHYGMF